MVVSDTAYTNIYRRCAYAFFIAVGFLHCQKEYQKVQAKPAEISLFISKKTYFIRRFNRFFYPHFRLSACFGIFGAYLVFCNIWFCSFRAFGRPAIARRTA